jgi:hypothetical protein
MLLMLLGFSLDVVDKIFALSCDNLLVNIRSEDKAVVLLSGTFALGSGGLLRAWRGGGRIRMC